MLPGVTNRTPIIGITAIPRTVHAGFGTYPGQTLGDAFIRAVEEAGGIPLILPSTEPAHAGRQVALVDALILSGGADVHPSLYGEDVRPEMKWLDEHRDAWELAVLEAARERELAILGICRGSQLLNVWRGGTLVTHLDSDVEHDAMAPDRHALDVTSGSLLAEVLGSTAVEVNTLHHQGLDRIGAGLDPVGRAPDGLVEAVEDRSARIIGVAWHPEIQLAETPGQALFDWIVRQAFADTEE
jgi:putative glutamine amidotransferase